jgi:hypothetical protein
MNFILEVNFITGFMLGFEWAPKGHLDEEEGYIVVDLGIFRFLVTYE